MYLTGLPRPTRLGIQKVELMQELESVRSEGYAIERGNFNAGVACVATPFFDALGKIAGAVAVSAPMERFDKEFENLIANAVATANSVTALYGGAS
jgi:DNA-binding IclR family transcriptional regulator